MQLQIGQECPLTSRLVRFQRTNLILYLSLRNLREAPCRIDDHHEEQCNRFARPWSRASCSAHSNDLSLSSHQKAVAIQTPGNSDPAPTSILNNLTFVRAVSTVPAVNGDLNPYGVAFVPRGFLPGGNLNPGDILVSNFNNSGNIQGTGTTIVKIAPDGTQSLFFQGSSLGLDTALAVLKSGFVLVGNVPSNPSTPVGTPTSTTPQGSIQVLDKFGNLVQTLSVQPLSPPSRVNGPWDMTVAAGRGSSALVFVSNVLSGTVWRYKLAVRPTTLSRSRSRVRS